MEAMPQNGSNHPEELELAALMSSARAGDERAYATMLAALAARLRPFFRNRLGERAQEAEDLVQETLIAIHGHRESYDARQPLRAWVFAIARYKLIDHLRREGLRVPVSLDAVGELFAAERADAGDAARDLDALMEELPERQRTALRLVKVEERSVREAAAASGMSEAAIRVNVHRGLKRLMALFARSERT
jgi:RNA polymerase sigma-70 factor (ECF subfamily)